VPVLDDILVRGESGRRAGVVTRLGVHGALVA
jgi:hypothetical protein